MAAGDMDETELNLLPMRGAIEQKNRIISSRNKTNAQEELLNAVINNNLDSLRHCMERSDVNLNHVYKTEAPVRGTCLYRGTCLNYAVEHGQTKMVRFLLKSNVRIDIAVDNGRLPLHLAVQGGHDTILSMLLKHGADVNAQDKQEWGALHMLAKQWTEEPAKYERVLNTLLAAPGVYVDILDCSRCTPLLRAVMNGAKELCRRLLEQGANRDYCSTSHCTRKLLQKKFPLLLEVMPTPEKAERQNSGIMLYEALKDSNEAKFDNALARVRALEWNACTKALERRNGIYTCLEYAANNGMDQEVRKLLEAGADCGSGPVSVSGSSDSGSPVEVVCGDRPPSALSYACSKGYHQVLKYLLEAVQKKANDGHNVDLLQPDVCGRTLLHKLLTAHTREAYPQVNTALCLNLLLNCNFPVGVNTQEKFGYTPLHFAVLSEDQNMVVTLLHYGANIGIADKFGKRPVDLIKEVTMKKAFNLSVQRENQDKNKSQGNCETEYTSNTNEPPVPHYLRQDHQYLHQDASITPSEAEAISITFHYNCLVPPTGVEALPHALQTAQLFLVSQSQRHKGLLLHPVLSSFLAVKWHMIRWLYIFAVMLYSAFVAILTAYVYLKFDVAPETGELRPSPLVSAGGLIAMEVALSVVMVLLVLRELLELALSWRDYLSDVENILQILLICLLAVMLIGKLTKQTRLHIAVLVIILAWLEFVLLLGRHPVFSTYIMMFKRVSENFIKLIFLYSFLVISLSIAFNLLFRTEGRFNTYLRALMMTVVMSTGEMDYNSLQFTHSNYLGHIAFFSFLFLIVLVLMNLLNGLAVSDTAKIQADAELNSLIARVRLIHHTEVAVLGLGRLGGGCCVGKTKRVTGYLSNACHWLERKVLLIPCCGKSRSMTARPDDDRYRLFCCRDKSFGVDKKVVDAALALVLSREQVSDDPIERKLDVLMKMVQEIKGSVKA